jgi:hypothetical protein
MGRERKLGKLWGRLKAGIVADVPPSLDACETCREVDCTEERWRTCRNRLEREAELLGALAGKAEAAAPGREAPDPGAPRPAPAKREEMDSSRRRGR